MKNNIKKYLIGAFVSVICVVSFGRLELSKTQNNVIAETELDFHTFSMSEMLVAGASKHYEVMDDVIVDVEDNDEDIVTSPAIEYKNGWITTLVNVRKEPNIESESLAVFHFNQQITYADFNEEWVQIEYEDGVAYVYKAYVSETQNSYREFIAPSTSGFKSFEPYTCFNPKYKQYQLQQHALTDENGLRQVNGRYCIALGTHFFENVTNDIIGTYIDIVLQNGAVIHCILGDIKADEHTDANNIITFANGCMSEFIVDKNQLPDYVRIRGDISYAKEEWKSPVAKVIVYEKNFFNEQTN